MLVMVLKANITVPLQNLMGRGRGLVIFSQSVWDGGDLSVAWLHP